MAAANCRQNSWYALPKSKTKITKIEKIWEANTTTWLALQSMRMRTFKESCLLTTMFAVMTSGSTHTDSTKKVFEPNRKHSWRKEKRDITDPATNIANTNHYHIYFCKIHFGLKDSSWMSFQREIFFHIILGISRQHRFNKPVVKQEDN